MHSKVAYKTNNNMTVLEQFTKVYKQIMKDRTIEEITPDMRLSEDLGLDSLKMIALAMNLEEQCNVSFAIGDINFKTVQQVIDYIEGFKKNGTS